MNNLILEKFHFNTQLLLKELMQRNIELSIIPGTYLIESNYHGHIEILDDIEISLYPALFRQILDDKWKTKMLLSYMGYSVVTGQLCSFEEFNEVEKFMNIYSPIVMKGTWGTHGHNVKMNIFSKEEAKMEFTSLVNELSKGTGIILEEQKFLNEFRLTVVQNGFYASVFRPLPSVVGDGESTIKELIAKVNYERLNKRVNCLCDIWVDREMERYLEKKGLSLESIPNKGEKIYVRSNSNVSGGAGCIDVTDIVAPEFLKIAFDILSSFTGVPFIGLDILTNDISEFGEYYICEINPSPGLSLHTHPEYGSFRDLPGAIVDLLYPETNQKN